MKQVNVLDAIYWVKHSWDEVEQSTIVKCFKKCGFGSDNTSSESDESAQDFNEDIPLHLVRLAHQLFGCEFSELVEIEHSIPTCDEEMTWDRPANELLKEQSEVVSDHSDDKNESEFAPVPSESVSLSDVDSYLEKLELFALSHCQSKMLSNLMELTEMATSLRIETTSQQSKISDFFKKC